MLRAGVFVRSSAGLFVLVFAVTAVLSLVMWRDVFTVAQLSTGDMAANQLLAEQGKHAFVLQGHYSRTGTNHPGPWIYWWTVGEWLFHDWTHLTPTEYNAEVLTCLLMQAAFVAISALVAFRVTRSRLAGVVAAACVLVSLAWWAGPDAPWNAWGNLWAPDVSYTFMLAAVPLTLAVACGRTAFLPALVVFGSFLIYTHVSFFLTFGLTFLVAAVFWWRAHRGHLRAEAALHRRSLIASAALFVLMWLPLAIRTVRDWPDPWKGWASVPSAGGQQIGPRSVVEWFQYALEYLGPPWWSWVVLAVVAVALLVLERDRRRRRLAGAALAVVAAWVAGSLVYAFAGVDMIWPFNLYAYLIYYLLAVPPVLLAVVLLQAASVLGERVPRLRAASARPVVAAGAAVAVAAGSVALVAAKGMVISGGVDEAGVHALAEELLAVADERGTVGFYFESTEDGNVWPYFVGVLVDAMNHDAKGLLCNDYAISVPGHRGVFSDAFPCDGVPDVAIRVAGDSTPSPGQTELLSYQGGPGVVTLYLEDGAEAHTSAP